MDEEQIVKVYRPRIVPALISGIFISAIIYINFLLRLPNFNFFGLTSIEIIVWALFTIATLGFGLINLLVQRYELKEDGVFIKAGIIAKSRGTILYSQIQDVREYQGIVARIFGVVNLEVKTMASASGSMINLSRNEASEIKQEILSRTKTHDKKSKESAKLDVIPYPMHHFKNAFALIVSFSIMWIIISFILLTLAYFLIFPLPNNIDISLSNEYVLIIFVLGSLIFSAITSAVFLISALVYNIALSYSLTSDYMETKFEFITKRELRIPFNKIQNFILKEGIVKRFAGLADFFIETGENPGTNRNERQAFLRQNTIPNLKLQDAQSLGNGLLGSMGIKNPSTKKLRMQYPLARIKPFKKSISATFYFSILAAIVFTILMFVYPSTQLGLIFAGVILLFFTLKLVYEIFYYRGYDYSDNEYLLLLRKGVFFIDSLIIPYSKIEHIVVDQDLFDRAFGLWDVHVASAGTTQMQLHIDGLKREYAEGLRNLLIKRTATKQR